MFYLKERLPDGIRTLTLATAVRWFGWGFSEAFIPVFLFSFVNSYAETGLFASTYSIVFLLTLPFAGMLADKIRIRTLIIAGLLIYPLIGLGYVLAGVTGIVLFLVVARALNGVAFAFDSVGRSTYFMHHAPKKKESFVFGYFDFVSNSWWLSAVFISMFLVSFVKIQWLFLAIIPTSLIAAAIVTGLKEGPKKRQKGLASKIIKQTYSGAIKEILGFGEGLQTVAVLTFFLGFAHSIIWLFIPITAYQQGADLYQTALVIVVYTIPSLFGGFLGKIADKKREKTLAIGTVLLMLSFFILSAVSDYAAYLAMAFFLGAILELFSLTNNGIITRITRPMHYGRVNSSMIAISDLGTIAGPVTFGLIVDALTIQSGFLAMACATAAMLLFILKQTKYVKKA